MNCKNFIILLLTLVSCVTWAKGKKRKPKHEGPPKYYYTLPVDATPEWSYEIPECQEIALEDYNALKSKCQPTKNNSEACMSRADIELKNPTNNQKKTFGLSYIIHNTRSACQDDRAKLLPKGTS